MQKQIGLQAYTYSQIQRSLKKNKSHVHVQIQDSLGITLFEVIFRATTTLLLAFEKY